MRSRPAVRAGLAIVSLQISATAVAQRTTQTVQHLGGGGSIDVSLGRIIVSLVICVVVAALAILLIRQRGGKADLAAVFTRLQVRKRAIDVVETRRLSPHADICVLRNDGREYLLLLQQGNAHILRVTEAAADRPGTGQ